MASCSPQLKPTELRRIFWVTQPSAKGTREDCDLTCGEAGLEITEAGIINNVEYVRGLALNILLTDGRREDTICGFRPGRRGGFWADSFRTDNARSGAQYRYVQPQGSVLQTLGIIRAYVQQDLQKLVTYGVAKSVSVTSEYVGKGVANMVATIITPGGSEVRVGVSGSRARNQWVWG